VKEPVRPGCEFLRTTMQNRAPSVADLEQVAGPRASVPPPMGRSRCGPFPRATTETHCDGRYGRRGHRARPSSAVLVRRASCKGPISIGPAARRQGRPKVVSHRAQRRQLRAQTPVGTVYVRLWWCQDSLERIRTAGIRLNPSPGPARVRLAPLSGRTAGPLPPDGSPSCLRRQGPPWGPRYRARPPRFVRPSRCRADGVR
jgi:hypothetical protein